MPSDRDSQQSPALSPLIRGLESLHLETATTEVQIEGLVPSSPTLKHLEMLVTAATMTSLSMDTLDHGKLFSSSVELYKHQGSTVPNTLESLDMSTTMQGLTATVNSRKTASLPAFRPGHQFGFGKVAADKVKDLDWLDETLCKLQLEVLDKTFDTLSEDVKCQRLDTASTFVKDGLVHIAHYKAKYKARASIIQSLKMFHVQICALYAPLLAECPLVIDAEYAYHLDFTYLDQINQVLVLLAIICNMIIGLSTLQCDLLINMATICVKLGMSTVSSGCSNPAHLFSPSQNEIISDMPTSLSAALKPFNADSHLKLYATCPSCSCTHKSISLAGPNLYEFPAHCTNQIIDKHGISVCGKELPTCQQDSTLQPSKPYLQSVNATDEALHAIHTGEEQIVIQNVFKASFIKDLKGPDRKLFVEREDKFPPVSKVASQKDHFIALLLNWRLTQPHNSSEFIVKTGVPKTLLYILKVVKEAVTPWLNSVPKDFGDAKTGTLKADEW
ncbi:hypothetical protein BT96DRAFT_1001309 [Gymnopus androsaceus JB14]|uniref:Uncharacterized protein n=1 Tax=Gymnopus androsaceus JB14 TaxID=1447944 RepID=A0A6A4H072_9AGAR|nr:hypothetical protein BT96DRAFT_1001309 [Gymnopus androsaceus JB14]